MSVIIADGHPVTCLGIEKLLTSEGIEVCGMCQDGEKTISLVRELCPKLVVMDLNLAGTDDSVKTLREVKQLPESPQVLIHTTRELVECVSSCVLAGADSYLHKRVGCEELLSTVRRTILGEKIWNVGKYKLHPDNSLAVVLESSRLTHREKEVLTLKFERRTNQEISWELGISVNTVKHHVTHIHKKLCTGNLRGVS